MSIKAPYYLLHLNGREIRFDAYSYAHILTRHFAHMMKPYLSKKDHFYDVFRHTDLHKRIENIFTAIDTAGVLRGSPIEDLTFRYDGLLYQMYIQPQESYVPGKSGAQTFLRLTTFFPLSDQDKQAKLKTEYDEKSINNVLSIFVPKPTITGNACQSNGTQS